MTTHGQAAKGMRLQLERLRERAEKAEAEVARLRAALEAVYEKYVVDIHGKNVCDCDDSVGLETCAPCVARAALRGGE